LQQKPDFVASIFLSSEYHREDKIAPWRCLNVTAILSSFAGHSRSFPAQAKSKSVGAFEIVPNSNALNFSTAFNTLCQRIGGVREVSFSKRCVVAFQLCGIASVYGQTSKAVSPKEVLFVAFQKTRRAARTDQSKRMSRRLAATLVSVSKSVHQSVRFSCVEALFVSEARMPSKTSGGWRQLSACVSDVLRDVRIVPSTVVLRPLGAKLN
jgi:hypothetical protein